MMVGNLCGGGIDCEIDYTGQLHSIILSIIAKRKTIIN